VRIERAFELLPGMKRRCKRLWICILRGSLVNFPMYSKMSKISARMVCACSLCGPGESEGCTVYNEGFDADGNGENPYENRPT
jgi:hypothetical protein